MTRSDRFPSHADLVIVGVGGIVGASLAHLLAELGVRNLVGLEKAGAIPSDIGSTSHASDFIFNTSHDKLANWTTAFSRSFYEKGGFFFGRGGMEICRGGHDARWEELKRKVGSGKAFGPRSSRPTSRSPTCPTKWVTWETSSRWSSRSPTPSGRGNRWTRWSARCPSGPR